MLYPKNFEEKIGFDKVRQWVASFCNGPLGRALVERVRFTDRHDVLVKLLSQTEEFRQLLAAGEPFPDSHFLDVRDSLARAAIPGAFLTEEAFFDLKLSLGTLFKCVEFLQKKDPTVFPQLRELSNNVAVNPQILSQIDKVIDERGQVRDTASPRLREIRQSLLAAQNSVRKRLDQIVRSLKAEGLVADEASLTIREGRMVVPVPAEYKRRVRGFVHDSSASGQTVFIEPAEVLEVNNEIRELQYEERHEIVRILTALTDALRPEIESLKKGYSFLGIIDFVRAKARFALAVRAIYPPVQPGPCLEWTAARHPLLQQHLEELGRQIVPLDLKLAPQQRILLISGPNAGGKSITLKTTGLLQYMLQCGLLIPVAEGSRAGLFAHLLIDIGDEQSIDNDLSTYSSHLKNMKSFLQWADPQSLCLIDEFGTGTEPELGGAIAEAMLEALNERQVWGVITTHYANLKFFAQNTPGIVNGAMRYDVDHLEPLFQLEIGRPGSSFALEIAQKIGLPRQVTAGARQKVGREKIDTEKLLRELEVEKRTLQARSQQLEQQQKQLESTLAEYTRLRDFMSQNRKQLLNEAKAEAKNLLREANQQIENTIREIKESQADKERTKAARQKLEQLRQNLQPETNLAPPPPLTEAEAPPELEIENSQIEVGDYVQIKDSGTVGQVLALKGKEISVAIGELKTNLKMNRVQKISRRSYRAQMPERKAPPSVGLNLNERMAHFNLDLDLRGKRAEDALVEVEQFVDQAIMLGHQNLRIVHGKGDGILRSLVRNRLKQYRQVATAEDEHADRGGAGVTLIKLH
ncbi:MAG: endonuclease MutS2 [Bernardetiaceae bacterium]|nr:endonuclease MutS2 [Bernardetiaceae bacterium]